jgi:hypothetical protein
MLRKFQFSRGGFSIRLSPMSCQPGRAEHGICVGAAPTSAVRRYSSAIKGRMFTIPPAEMAPLLAIMCLHPSGLADAFEEPITSDVWGALQLQLRL